MRASSLFFVVIIAVWLMYMGQHWVRRREDLTTARSVDRFSDAMRMLERRSPVRHERSVTQHQTRPAVLRPEVSVKGAPTIDQEAETMKVDADAMKKNLPAANSREVKAGALLTSVVFLVLTLGLAPFGVVSWWLPVIGLLSTTGVVYWLRQTAIAAQREAKAAKPAPRRTAGSTQAKAAPQTKTASKPVKAETAAAVSQDANTGSTRVAVAQRPAQDVTLASPMIVKATKPNTQTVDVEPDLQAPRKAEEEVFDAGWAPVDVPRPTYTMKAKAEREEVAPAATIDDTRPLAAQYADTPVEELPFDGMALDEDYDELPAVYRAS